MHDSKVMKRIKKIRVNKIVVIVEIVAILFTLVSGVVFYKYACDDKRHHLKDTIDGFVEELKSENLFEKYSFDNRDVDANSEEAWYLKSLFLQTANRMSGWYDDNSDFIEISQEGEYAEKYPAGVKYEFYDKNGTKLCSSNEDFGMDVLEIYDDDELSDSYILKSFFYGRTDK